MKETIETERLLLRPLEGQDAGRLAYLLGEYDVAKMTATVPHPYLPISAEGWLMIQSGPRKRGERYNFAVTTKRDGLIVSSGITLRSDVGAENVWEIGYWIGKPYWGEGYASEAGEALMEWARRETGAEAFTAGHFHDNPASGRILAKLGFEHTGTQEAYGLARNEVVACERYVWPQGTKLDNVDPHALQGRAH